MSTSAILRSGHNSHQPSIPGAVVRMPCMLAAYLEDGRLLRALARVLELPAVACTTAFTYLHRIRLLQHDIQLTGQELVTACIYVAAKVEEVQLSANQLINSARILSHPAQQHLLQSLAPLPAHLVSQQLREQQQPRQVSVPGQQQQAQQQQQEEESNQVDNLTPIAAAVVDNNHQQQQQHQRGHLSLQQHQPVATQPNAAEHKQSKRQLQQQQQQRGHLPQQQHQQHHPVAIQPIPAEHKQSIQQQEQQQAYPSQQQQQEAATPALTHPHPNAVASNSKHPQQQSPQTTLPAAAVVVGDEYYQAKDALFTAEQIVLRLINFKLEAPQPHKHLLNFCKVLCVSQVVAAAAVCLLNDVIAYTGLCVRTDPAVLAAAVLECCWECLCRTARSISHHHQQQQEEEEQPAQPRDLCSSSPSGSVHALCPSSNEKHEKLNADLAASHAANCKSHQLPQLARDAQLQSVPQWSHHHKQDDCDYQPRDSVSLQQQQQQAQNSSPGSTGRGQAQRHRDRYEHQSRQQQQQRHYGQSNSRRSVDTDMPGAVLDGSWVDLVGLDRRQVTELSQQLRQLLTSEQQEF